jgi:transposase-like protein
MGARYPHKGDSLCYTMRMPPVDRNAPKRGSFSDSTYSLMEFMRDYPDDATCLDFLWRERYAPDGSHAHCPTCKQERKFHKVKERPAWDCDHCGHHLHPLAGTIFQKSSTSLQLWFYAIFLMTSTRCGVSAKQLERELGVTYKTAWRIFNKIRNNLMTDLVERLTRLLWRESPVRSMVSTHRLLLALLGARRRRNSVIVVEQQSLLL